MSNLANEFKTDYKIQMPLGAPRDLCSHPTFPA